MYYFSNGRNGTKGILGNLRDQAWFQKSISTVLFLPSHGISPKLVFPPCNLQHNQYLLTHSPTLPSSEVSYKNPQLPLIPFVGASSVLFFLFFVACIVRFYCLSYHLLLHYILSPNIPHYLLSICSAFKFEAPLIQLFIENN